jgi:hypothetical protein
MPLLFTSIRKKFVSISSSPITQYMPHPSHPCVWFSQEGLANGTN